MQDYVLLPRTEYYTTETGNRYLLRELTCQQLITLTSIYKRLEADLPTGELELREMREIVAPMLADGKQVDADLIEVSSRLVTISVDDVLISNASHKSPDPLDCVDAGLVRTLHMVGTRYAKTPVELARELTYRQALYMFVLAYNDILTERKIAGCKVADKDYLNAWGLMCNTKGLSEAHAMEYYGRQSLARREAQQQAAKHTPKRGA